MKCADEVVCLRSVDLRCTAMDRGLRCGQRVKDEDPNRYAFCAELRESNRPSLEKKQLNHMDETVLTGLG